MFVPIPAEAHRAMRGRFSTLFIGCFSREYKRGKRQFDASMVRGSRTQRA
jgi:hypothetical protein